MQKVFAVLSVFSICGCINMSTLQTAEVLDKGQGRVLIGGGYYTSPSINTALEDASEEASEGTEAEPIEMDDLKVPYAEVGYRYGVADKFDAGVKLTLIGTLAIDGKYQFLDAGDFDMATGLALGYVDLESSSGSGDTEIKSTSTIIDVVLPLYTSYRLAKAAAIYVSPKGVYRQITNTTTGLGDDEETSAGSTMVGGTVGLMLGDTWGMALEGTYFKDTKSEFDMVQTSAALFF